jgi:hypothetical protein
MSELLSISPESEQDRRSEEILAAYDAEMEDYLQQTRAIGATAFEVLARPMETVQPVEAVQQTSPSKTGPDNNGQTHTDYGDVKPEPPKN